MKNILSRLILLYSRNSPLDYGKNFLKKFIFIQNEELQYKNKNGILFHLKLNEYQMREIFIFDGYEQNTLRHLSKLKKRLKIGNNATIIDCGANIGFYALTLEKIFKSHVHCFEPNPYTFSILEKNVKSNNNLNITSNPFGLSDTIGEFELTYSDDNLGAASIYGNSFNLDSKNVKVDLSTLDKYCENNNISKVDVIKVDIEGGELKFLIGASKIIEKSNKCILIIEIMESHCQRAGYSADFLFRFIIEMGFVAYLPKGWPFGLRKVSKLPRVYNDNVIFVKNTF